MAAVGLRARNQIQTAGQGRFTILCLYAPLEPWFGRRKCSFSVEGS